MGDPSWGRFVFLMLAPSSVWRSSNLARGELDLQNHHKSCLLKSDTDMYTKLELNKEELNRENDWSGDVKGK
jgi:hypothetical protein